MKAGGSFEDLRGAANDGLSDAGGRMRAIEREDADWRGLIEPPKEAHRQKCAAFGEVVALTLGTRAKYVVDAGNVGCCLISLIEHGHGAGYDLANFGGVERQYACTGKVIQIVVRQFMSQDECQLFVEHLLLPTLLTGVGQLRRRVEARRRRKDGLPLLLVLRDELDVVVHVSRAENVVHGLRFGKVCRDQFESVRDGHCRLARLRARRKRVDFGYIGVVDDWNIANPPLGCCIQIAD